MTEFNTLIQNVEPSRSVTLMAKTKAMQKVDPSIINLTAGEPDFPTPKRISDETIKYLEAGYTHYVDGPGIPELRARIAKKLQEENHAPYGADQILVTPGAKFAVYAAVRALVNPGDEVLWLTPGWVSYPSIVQASGGTPVAVHLKWEEDYKISLEALENATSERTKALIINYPNNPTGKILTAADREVLAQYMRNHPQIYLISDEIYEKVIFDDNEIVSMASYPEFFARVVVINGLSKATAMTGWRLGYLACNPDLFQVIMKLNQHTMSCVCGFLQKGAVVAFDCSNETEEMRQEYEKRRDLFVDGLNSIDGVEVMVPQGAFYAWVSFNLGKDAQELCNWILEEGKVAGVPGDAYGEEGRQCVRFSFATSIDNLKAAVEKIRSLVENSISK